MIKRGLDIELNVRPVYIGLYHEEYYEGPCRFSPDLKKLFVGRGEVVGGGDFDKENCNNYLIYRVADQKKYFDAQMQVGTHLPIVYGDYSEELSILGESLGMEVLRV